MAESDRWRTKITDMDRDALVQCASLLDLQDISNFSLSCKYLNSVAYSDSLWLHLFRERWPQQVPSTPGVRGAYLTKLSALHKFCFADPLVAEFYTDPKFFDHLVIDQNNVIFSQGPLLHMLKIGSFLNTNDPLLTLRDHNARITSMRFFPLSETSLFRSESDRNENVLVTSSCDHSIRLWWKGCCQRSFRGHSGPVTTLSDKLVGDGNGKLFASGGDDGTVRLWSLTSGGKRGQHALKATLKGHGRPLVLMSVAGHNQSLLVSMSKDSKVRVWDTITSSSVRSSCCVGMTSVPGAPVGMKCHESLLYVAAGSSVAAIDLRTMRKVFSTPCYQSRLYSFELLPSKSLICAGGIGSAMLWDVRRCSETLKVNPVSELDGHIGPITHLHMDQYKIVSGGPEDCSVHVWDSDTGKRTNSLVNGCMDAPSSTPGCCAMAVNGCQIVTSNLSEEFGVIHYRDFSHSTCSLSSAEDDYADEDTTPGSKFWGSQSCSDSEESDG